MNNYEFKLQQRRDREAHMDGLRTVSAREWAEAAAHHRRNRKPPTWEQRRFTEMLRIHKSLMAGDGYIETHYPMTFATGVMDSQKAIAIWEERNPFTRDAEVTE